MLHCTMPAGITTVSAGRRDRQSTCVTTIAFSCSFAGFETHNCCRTLVQALHHQMICCAHACGGGMCMRPTHGAAPTRTMAAVPSCHSHCVHGTAKHHAAVICSEMTLPCIGQAGVSLE